MLLSMMKRVHDKAHGRGFSLPRESRYPSAPERRHIGMRTLTPTTGISRVFMKLGTTI